jgi:hypothetical protein
MTKRYFTVEETNDLVPQLEEVFRRVVQVYAQVKATWESLDTRGLAPDSEHFSIDGDTPASALDELTTLRALLDALDADINTVTALGCAIKRLDTGLVDWYALKDGREVYLCWQLGEKRVDHWHELHTGFAGRRPIAELRS